MIITTYEDALLAHKQGGKADAFDALQALRRAYDLDKQLTRDEQAVLSALISRMWGARTVRMSKPAIMERTGVSSNYVAPALRGLEQKGIIVKWRGRHDGERLFGIQQIEHWFTEPGAEFHGPVATLDSAEVADERYNALPHWAQEWVGEVAEGAGTIGQTLWRRLLPGLEHMVEQTEAGEFSLSMAISALEESTHVAWQEGGNAISYAQSIINRRQLEGER